MHTTIANTLVIVLLHILNLFQALILLYNFAWLVKVHSSSWLLLLDLLVWLVKLEWIIRVITVMRGSLHHNYFTLFFLKLTIFYIVLFLSYNLYLSLLFFFERILFCRLPLIQLRNGVVKFIINLLDERVKTLPKSYQFLMMRICYQSKSVLLSFH